MNKGIFITIEGGEGAGKTTILKKVADQLQHQGIKTIVTREPGGIKIAEAIRSVILDKANTAMDARTEALLYAAARRQHLVEKVIPAINDGYVVLCDRFIDSSLAYQGVARGIGIHEVRTINEFAIEGYMPDLTLFFDIDPSEGLKRISKDSNREINRLDLEANAFHEKVRKGYEQVVNEYRERIIVIDANQPVDVVFKEAMAVIENRILQ
ncbi:dTMP kinase [Alkalihalobacterium bogoriense]|uniref:dTMP kinase n=1 Tax=Alkalihalobacterium bogoriense TaxID=246272 RepID=UPI00047B4E38|nr:dTMP kinase [Alkalihalobacterium bogoriense]